MQATSDCSLAARLLHRGPASALTAPTFPSPCRSQPAAASAPSAFTYNKGGQDWPGMCQAGQRQSPIAITSGGGAQELPTAGRANLQFVTARGLRVFNTGRTTQVNGRGASGGFEGGVWRIEREAGRHSPRQGRVHGLPRRSPARTL